MKKIQEGFELLPEVYQPLPEDETKNAPYILVGEGYDIRAMIQTFKSLHEAIDSAIASKDKRHSGYEYQEIFIIGSEYKMVSYYEWRAYCGHKNIFPIGTKFGWVLS